jgi:hypothetical protein
LQSWKTFVRNHMEGIAAIDLFVVPTIAFQQLFAFLIFAGAVNGSASTHATRRRRQGA